MLIIKMDVRGAMKNVIPFVSQQYGDLATTVRPYATRARSKVSEVAKITAKKTGELYNKIINYYYGIPSVNRNKQSDKDKIERLARLNEEIYHTYLFHNDQFIKNAYSVASYESLVSADISLNKKIEEAFTLHYQILGRYPDGALTPKSKTRWLITLACAQVPEYQLGDFDITELEETLTSFCKEAPEEGPSYQGDAVPLETRYATQLAPGAPGKPLQKVYYDPVNYKMDNNRMVARGKSRKTRKKGRKSRKARTRGRRY